MMSIKASTFPETEIEERGDREDPERKKEGKTGLEGKRDQKEKRDGKIGRPDRTGLKESTLKTQTKEDSPERIGTAGRSTQIGMQESVPRGETERKQRDTKMIPAVRHLKTKCPQDQQKRRTTETREHSHLPQTKWKILMRSTHRLKTPPHLPKSKKLVMRLK